MGGNFLNALLEQGYQQEHGLYAVNPKMTEVRGVRCYPTVLDCPDPVDHVISQIPSEGLTELVDQCIRKGVRSLHSYTAGLAETGDPELVAQEREMVAKARAAGMRLIGPNCMGLYVPGVGLAFNSRAPRRPGNVFMLSQSGANAGGMIEGLGRLGLRFSKGVSYGNAADLKSHDFLDYALEDAQTELVVAYVEGPRDGRAFFEALRRLAWVKPTIVLKGGITEDGARAASSHTGSLAGSIDVFDAVCRQAGAMRVRTLEDLLDLSVAVTTSMRHLAGNRVTLMGVGGGFAVLSADQMAMEGLAVPWLPEATQEQLREIIPLAGTSIRNPVDANFGRDHPVDFSSNVGLTRRVFQAIAAAHSTDMVFTTVGTRWYPGTGRLGRFAPPRAHADRRGTVDGPGRASRADGPDPARGTHRGRRRDRARAWRGAVPRRSSARARAASTILEWRRRREGLPELFAR